MYQTDDLNDPKKVLPTMYDLPSEDREEPGLPDEFHYFQPHLLRTTFHPANYSPDEVFSGTDMNLYYDVRHTGWYKRPDCFAVVGVDRLYEQQDMRLSYVVWQEGINPFVVVELLSPGTEKEDLGQTLRKAENPPTKWEVYERILRVPYYIVFDRYTNQLRAFQLTGSHYTELELIESRIWMEDIGLGLGLWQGFYEGIERLWLRCYDRNQNWIATPQEIAKQEKLRGDKLAQKLIDMGIDPEEI